MMQYFTEESFGSILPDNWEQIVDLANSVIDEYAQEHTTDEVDEWSRNDLWEDVCSVLSHADEASYKLDSFFLCSSSSFEDFCKAYAKYTGSPYGNEDTREADFIKYCNSGFITFHGSLAATWIDGI